MPQTVFDACHLNIDQLLAYLETLEKNPKEPEGFYQTKRIDERTFECQIGSIWERIDTFYGCGSSLEDAKLIPLVEGRLDEDATLDFKMRRVQRTWNFSGETYFTYRWVATLKERKRVFSAEDDNIGTAALAVYLLSWYVKLEVKP